jgi:hypothetical protein
LHLSLHVLFTLLFHNLPSNVGKKGQCDYDEKYQQRQFRTSGWFVLVDVRPLVMRRSRVQVIQRHPAIDFLGRNCYEYVEAVRCALPSLFFFVFVVMVGAKNRGRRRARREESNPELARIFGLQQNLEEAASPQPSKWRQRENSSLSIQDAKRRFKLSYCFH